MPHKRAKAVGKLLFFDNKTTPRSIDRFGFNDVAKLRNNTKMILAQNRFPVYFSEHPRCALSGVQPPLIISGQRRLKESVSF